MLAVRAVVRLVGPVASRYCTVWPLAEPSAMKYEAEKPQALLEEDKAIGAIKLGIPAQAVQVIPAEEVFRR